MCGKFTAQASWGDVVAFSQPLTSDGGEGSGGEGDGGDQIVTFRVGSMLPVIVWDGALQKRVIVKMRWGFPDRIDWKRPKPIHARAETIDVRPQFRKAFKDGQRGIVAVKTFNEGEEVPTKTGGTKTRQWTIDPRPPKARGFAFLWDTFPIPHFEEALTACVMVTVPANQLVRDNIKSLEPDPRMPAILEDDAWPAWLGETWAPPEEVKALLKTMEGVNWLAAPEPQKPRPQRR